MCLLTFFPPGVQPDPEHLLAGASVNRDGYGFAIVTAEGLKVHKSMVAKSLVEKFTKARARHPDGPALFHSRMGTGGVRSTYNCHPFYTDATKTTVVAHNGVLWGATHGAGKCDTREFAEAWMGKYFWDLDDRRNKRYLEKWAGRGNKIVVLTADDFYTKQAYLFNDQGGVWTPEGVWHSNNDYLTNTAWLRLREERWARREAEWAAQEAAWAAAVTAVHKDSETAPEALPLPDDGVTCFLCEGVGTVVRRSGHCTQCRRCNDCGDLDTECACFIPAVSNWLTS